MMNNPHAFIGPVNLGNPHEFTMLRSSKAEEVILHLPGSRSKIMHSSRQITGLDDSTKR